MTALLTDNLPLLAGTPNGIQKLRELILELAVRGKLVPQDPSDEPASELLKRIAEEKARLVAEGKIRKQKPLAEIGEEDKPFELPEGWEWVRLGEIAEVIRGVTYGKSDSSETLLLDYAPLLRANNINRVLNFEKLVFVPKNLIAEQQYVRCGDVVIAMSSGSADLVGKAAQAEADYEGAFGAFCGVVRARNFELFPFFGFFFQTPLYRRRAAGHGKGIGINNLQKSVLETLEIPLPPLAEQHRIVAKVDELMALCDRLEARQADAESAHARLVQALLDSLTQASDADDFAASWQRLAEHFHSLFTSESSIDALKQTLLQLAVMGKLVPQDPSDEPARELLKRIAEEKARLVAEGKLKKQKPLAEIDEKEKSFSLPLGWEWVCLGRLCDVKGGKRLPAGAAFSPTETPYIYIQVTNMKGGSIVDKNLKYIDSATRSAIQQYTISRDDLYITIAGTIADVGIVPDRFDGMNLTENAAKLVFQIIDRRWLQLALSSNFSRNQFLDKTNQLAQPKLALHRIADSIVALPPLTEQHRIVAKVDQLMSLCDQLKARLVAARQLHERLAGALLEQAVA